MKLNAGILTHKITEIRAFYTENLGFRVKFENEFYLLLHTPNHEADISFLQPNHPSQQTFSRTRGYLTIEVEDVEKIFSDLKKKDVEIKIDLREEPWGDRHLPLKILTALDLTL